LQCSFDGTRCAWMDAWNGQKSGNNDAFAALHSVASCAFLVSGWMEYSLFSRRKKEEGKSRKKRKHQHSQEFYDSIHVIYRLRVEDECELRWVSVPFCSNCLACLPEFPHSGRVVRCLIDRYHCVHLETRFFLFFFSSRSLLKLMCLEISNQKNNLLINARHQNQTSTNASILSTCLPSTILRTPAFPSRCM
jgi:hypothetical protein